MVKEEREQEQIRSCGPVLDEADVPGAIPHPLRHHLLALLPPGRVRAPPIGIDLSILIGQSRLKGAAMQIEFDDIGSGECMLWKVGKEEFVDNACTGHAHWTLLLASLIGGHNDAAVQAL